MTRLMSLHEAALLAGTAPASEATVSNSLKYWHSFCEETGVDEQNFGGQAPRLTHVMGRHDDACAGCMRLPQDGFDFPHGAAGSGRCRYKRPAIKCCRRM